MKQTHIANAYPAEVMANYIKQTRKNAFKEVRRLEKERGSKFGEIEKLNFISKYVHEELTRKK
ncbi:hypothetical protein KDW60_28630 [Burkholderia cenocepacia]|uniref:hypothetical protein n=1 Tax=Burkholderia cenocepacia TaxID=95486 RepID=UPI001B9A450A|nr:hypothetical protein [Burkholderia cenocepacia]MBR7940697.1 hypothetical protein [Burkholderia cenocepacia]MBR8480070.1 hypothetical protein [Burkholderia cenocepacia]